VLVHQAVAEHNHTFVNERQPIELERDGLGTGFRFTERFEGPTRSEHPDRAVQR
jgi:hypothetical protein